MSSVADDWNLDFRVVRHLGLLASLVRSHGNLEASRHGLEFVCGPHIAVLQARSHWVNIEEGVLPVLGVRRGLPVERLVALVPDCWQI